MASDPVLIAARQVAGDAWTVLAELGRSDATTAFVVRDRRRGDLAVMRADERAPGEDPTIEVLWGLDEALPGPGAVCPACGRTVEGWVRRCACGTDLAGSVIGGPGERERLDEWVRQATAEDYDVLGRVPYTEDDGWVYFARQRVDGAIVALRLRDEGRFSDGTARYGITPSLPLPSLDPVAQSPYSGPVHFTPAEAIPVLQEHDEPRDERPFPPPLHLQGSVLGSGLLAKLPTPRTDEQVAVPRVCPQCGAEYETGSRFCPSDGSPLRPKVSEDPLIGQVIADRYQVLQRIGEGGMGRVYLAEHVKMNRQCAIKVMSGQLTNDPEAAQRFAREASNAARIIHPNVAAVFDYGESEGVVYLVMEYVDGEPLSRLLERERAIAPARAVSIARQVAEALVAAHELGIVHRDLKPDNILLTRARSGREVAKVVDFGIAKAMQEAREDRLTGTGLVIGTPEYMSPEQLLGDPVDARSDIYSLGCIIFQMLTGALPFDAPTREQIVKRRLGERAQSPRELVPELPESLDRIVRTMLARSPMDRYPTALDVRDALDPVTALGRGWDPAYTPTPRSAPTQLMLAATTEKLYAERRARLGRRAAAGSGLVLLAVGAAAGFWLSRPARPVPAATAATAAESLAARRAIIPVPVGVPDSTPAAVATRPPKSAAAPPTTPALRADSIARTAPRPSDAAAPKRVTPEERAMRAPVEAFVHAIETRSADSLRAAYPGINGDQIGIFEKTLFPQTEKIDAHVEYGPSQIHGDTAVVDVAITLDYVYRESKTEVKGIPVAFKKAYLIGNGRQWRLARLEQ